MGTLLDGYLTGDEVELQKLIAGRYLIENLHLDRIGRGGAGNVYRALDNVTNRPVAIKHLKPELIAADRSLVARFEREGEALRRLNHPNIVAMLATEHEGDEYYLVMEYVPGGSLAEMLERDRQLPLESVMRIALELADALTRAHHLNIIHRDIKPANVLLAQDGAPRLTDFGVAHFGDLAPITQTGALTGTYAYLSPEACEGQPLDARADIWSFGVLLYEMLTGRTPFLENTLSATLLAILTKPAPDIHQFRADTPESLANLIYHMLQKDREHRVGSVRLVGARLEAIMAGLAGDVGIPQRFETSVDVPAAPAIGPRHNLPWQPTPFVGREPEIQEVVNTLSDPDCRLLTLVGPGGIGKTRLSLEAARRKVEDYEHGVRFVPLAAVTGPEYLETAIADTLGIVFFDEAEPAEQLANYLRSKQMLLVLDNFEHLIEGAQRVSDLLALAPRLQVLVTSREALNLWEEWTRPVRGMRYPADLRETEISPYSAVRLFIARAKRVLGQFELEQELPHIIRICQLVDGMPLGIELAATWLRVLTPAQIVREIERSFDFLETNMRNIAERHRSIRAVFDYSWQLLDARSQTAFRRLAVFQGGFRRRAAERVAETSLLTLTDLVNKSLLYEGESHYTDTPGPEGRYSIHELLKQYAEEKLEQDPGEQQEISARHAAYFSQLLRNQELRLHGNEQKEALDLISQDLDNIRQAWQWSVSNLWRQDSALFNLREAAESLYIFYETRGLTAEADEMFSNAIAALNVCPIGVWEPARRQTHTLTLAKVSSYRGVIHYRMSRREQAMPPLREAITLLRQLVEDPATDETVRREAQRELPLTMVYLSDSVARAQSLTEAREMLREAIEICRASNERWQLARSLNALAIHTIGYQEQVSLYKQALAVANEIGDQILSTRILQNLSGLAANPYESIAYADQIFAIYERIGNPAGLMMACIQTGIAASRLGEFERARSNFERALQICQDFGLREGLGGVLWGLAQVSWALGDLEDTERRYNALLEICSEDGDREQIIKTLYQYGSFLIEYGRVAEARQQYKTALSLLTEIALPTQRAESLDSLGNFALELGKYDLARKHFEDAAPLFEEINDPNGYAWALTNLGKIAFETGDYVTAKARYEESLSLHQSQGTPWLIGRLLNMLGRVYLAECDLPQAAGCFQEALQVLSEVWADGIEMEVLIDWCSLLMRNGDKQRALETLYLVTTSPRFVPSLVSKRSREMAARLLDELEAYLPADMVAEAAVRARQMTPEELIAGVLADAGVHAG